MTHLQHHPLTLTPSAPLENTVDFKMSNPSSSTDPNMTTSSDNSQLDLFAPELLELVSDPEIVEHLHAAFSIGSMLIQYYQHMSLSIAWMVDILDRHYEERNDLFQYAISNKGFKWGIWPVTREYRRKRQELSHPYSWLLSRIQTLSDELSVDPPSSSGPNNEPPPSDTQSIPIFPEPSDVSSLSYATVIGHENAHARMYQNSECRSYEVTLKAGCRGYGMSGVMGSAGVYDVGARTRP